MTLWWHIIIQNWYDDTLYSRLYTHFSYSKLSFERIAWLLTQFYDSNEHLEKNIDIQRDTRNSVTTYIKIHKTLLTQIPYLLTYSFVTKDPPSYGPIGPKLRSSWGFYRNSGTLTYKVVKNGPFWVSSWPTKQVQKIPFFK